MHSLPNLSHLPHDSAPNEAEVHLTLALVQLRHARLFTRRFIIDDGSGTSIVATWDFVQRYGPAGPADVRGPSENTLVMGRQRPIRPDMISALMSPGIEGLNYFRPSVKTSGMSCFPCRPSPDTLLQQHLIARRSLITLLTVSSENRMLSFPCSRRSIRCRPIPLWLWLYIRTSIAAMEKWRSSITKSINLEQRLLSQSS